VWLRPCIHSFDDLLVAEFTKLRTLDNDGDLSNLSSDCLAKKNSEKYFFDFFCV
jgi:hypothetical protein